MSLPKPRLPRAKLSREEILEACRKTMRSKGEAAISSKELKELGIPYSQVQKHFGGIEGLRRVLGLEPSKYHRRFSDVALLKLVLRIAKMAGRAPDTKDIMEHGRKLTGYSPLAAIKRRFGGVRRAYWLAYGCDGCKGRALNEPIRGGEEGVKALFWRIADAFAFELVGTRKFPDALLRLGQKRYATEFEYRSSDFQRHGHDPSLVDLIVCWEHD